jgi:hypothetical protein
MGSHIQPVDLISCTYEQAFRQLVAMNKHLKFHNLLAHDDAVWVIYRWYAFQMVRVRCRSLKAVQD